MENETCRKISDYLEEKLNPAFIIVFGSQARGNANRESDVDIAFFKKGPCLSSYEIFAIAQGLAAILNKNVDLIDLQKASTVFQAQIYANGIVVYIKDQACLNKQRMLAYSMYARLNEERRGILKNIRESGSVYGR